MYSYKNKSSDPGIFELTTYKMIADIITKPKLDFKKAFYKNLIKRIMDIIIKLIYLDEKRVTALSSSSIYICANVE